MYPEIYDKPNFSYQPVRNKQEPDIIGVNTITPTINDPNNPFPNQKVERMATSVTSTKEHTLPFTLKNLEQLWAMRKPQIALVIKNESVGDANPIQIPKCEDFKKPFDTLWDWATTPKFSLDRSVKDNLQDQQYK